MINVKTIMVRWNGFTRKWYEEKGYVWTKINDYFQCKIEDVQINSTAKVEAICDYCGEKFYPEYRQLLSARNIVNKDCCSNRKCVIQKSEEVNMVKFGYRNHMCTEESKRKLSEKQRTPFSQVQKDFQNKNLELLSTESDYQNDRSRLLFICNNHKEYGIQESNYANIKKNKGCCNYGKGELCAESSRLDGNIVFQAFVNKGLLPQFKPKDYKKNNQLLPFLCPDHLDKGIQKTNYATLLASPYKCYYCGKENMAKNMMLNQDEVFDYYRNRGLIVEDREIYEGKDIHIKFRCPHHIEHIQQVTYNGLKKTKQPCEFCKTEESLTSLNKRLRSSITFWKKESQKNCNYKCIFTGSKQYDIHHLYSYNNIIKEALKELNIELKDKYKSNEFIKIKNKVIELHNKYPLGVCISNNIHTLFHQLYSKEVTIQDFEEFKERYKSSEFNNILEKVG